MILRSTVNFKTNAHMSRLYSTVNYMAYEYAHNYYSSDFMILTLKKSTSTQLYSTLQSKANTFMLFLWSYKRSQTKQWNDEYE